MKKNTDSMASRATVGVTLALLAAMGGGFWYLTAEPDDLAAINAAMPSFSSEPESVQSDGDGVQSMVHQRAVMACLLAATYGAERGAKIRQAEAVLSSLPANLDQAGRAEADGIRQLIPLNKQERDASYRLYFQGIAALGRGDSEEVARALNEVEVELTKAGLTRLVRYIKPVREQIAAAREGGVSSEVYPKLIKELEDAVISQN